MYRSKRGMGQQCAWYDIGCLFFGNAAQAAAAAQAAQDVTQAQNAGSATSGLSLTITQDYPQGPPSLATGSVSPGLPVGYDPSTGLISGDYSGMTQNNPFVAALPGLSPGQAASGNFASSLASLPGWAWGLIVGVGGFAVMSLAAGGRR